MSFDDFAYGVAPARCRVVFMSLPSCALIMHISCAVIMSRLSCPPDVVPLALHQSRNVASDLLLAVASQLPAEASVEGGAQTESPPTQRSQSQGHTVLGSRVDRQRHNLAEGGLTGQAYHQCSLPLRVKHRPLAAEKLLSKVMHTCHMICRLCSAADSKNNLLTRNYTLELATH